MDILVGWKTGSAHTSPCVFNMLYLHSAWWVVFKILPGLSVKKCLWYWYRLCVWYLWNSDSTFEYYYYYYYEAEEPIPANVFRVSNIIMLPILIFGFSGREVSRYSAVVDLELHSRCFLFQVAKCWSPPEVLESSVYPTRNEENASRAKVSQTLKAREMVPSTLTLWKGYI